MQRVEDAPQQLLPCVFLRPPGWLKGDAHHVRHQLVQLHPGTVRQALPQPLPCWKVQRATHPQRCAQRGAGRPVERQDQQRIHRHHGQRAAQPQQHAKRPLVELEQTVPPQTQGDADIDEQKKTECIALRHGGQPAQHGGGDDEQNEQPAAHHERQDEPTQRGAGQRVTPALAPLHGCKAHGQQHFGHHGELHACGRRGRNAKHIRKPPQVEHPEQPEQVDGAYQGPGVCHEDGAKGRAKHERTPMVKRIECEEQVAGQRQLPPTVHRRRHGKEGKEQAGQTKHARAPVVRPEHPDPASDQAAGHRDRELKPKEQGEGADRAVLRGDGGGADHPTRFPAQAHMEPRQQIVDLLLSCEEAVDLRIGAHHIGLFDEVFRLQRHFGRTGVCRTGMRDRLQCKQGRARWNGGGGPLAGYHAHLLLGGCKGQTQPRRLQRRPHRQSRRKQRIGKCRKQPARGRALSGGG